MPKSRIPSHEYEKIKKMEIVCRAKEFSEFRKKFNLPDVYDVSRESAIYSRDFLEEVFMKQGYSLLDAIVAMKGHGPATDNDTHYRGRVLEEVLGGHSTSKSESDFGYAELKLIETYDPNNLVQVMTAGVIFEKKNKSYNIVHRFEDSLFYKKMKRAIIVSYKKEGRQLGFSVNGVFMFELLESSLFFKIKEDWEHIRDGMINAINAEQAGLISRKPSGILSSKLKTPNGYLGVRSDGVVITNKLFKLISICK